MPFNLDLFTHALLILISYWCWLRLRQLSFCIFPYIFLSLQCILWYISKSSYLSSVTLSLMLPLHPRACYWPNDENNNIVWWTVGKNFSCLSGTVPLQWQRLTYNDLNNTTQWCWLNSQNLSVLETLYMWKYRNVKNNGSFWVFLHIYAQHTYLYNSAYNIQNENIMYSWKIICNLRMLI